METAQQKGKGKLRCKSHKVKDKEMHTSCIKKLCKSLSYSMKALIRSGNMVTEADKDFLNSIMKIDESLKNTGKFLHYRVTHL